MKVSLRLRGRHFTHFGQGGERKRTAVFSIEATHKKQTRDLQFSLTFRRRENEINIQLCVYLQYSTVRTNKNERFWFVQAFCFLFPFGCLKICGVGKGAKKEWRNSVMGGGSRKLLLKPWNWMFELWAFTGKNVHINVYGHIIHCSSDVSWLKYPSIHKTMPRPCRRPQITYWRSDCLFNIFSRLLRSLQGSPPLGYLKINPSAPYYYILSTSPHPSPFSC